MAIPLSRRLDFSEIPVIDIAPLIDGSEATAERTITALGKACADIGFIYVKNHGVPRDLVARIAGQSKQFFARPMDEKMQIALDERLRGYLPLNYRSYE